jgi:two-component system, OmpR family, sensor histidine kinase TctE
MLRSNEQRSLFGEILDWMLVPLVVLWPLSLAFTWAVAQNIASRPFDRELGERVRTLAAKLEVRRGMGGDANAPQVLLPAAALEELLRAAAEDEDRIQFQVLGARGEWVAGDLSMTLPETQDDERGRVLYRDENQRDEPMRAAWLWLPLTPSGGPQVVGDADATPRYALVQIAETLNKRERLATEIIKGVLLPQFAILPLAVGLIWVALSRAFRPLNDLQRRIRRRDSGDLSPLDERAVPEEVAPLVRSINDLLGRLEQSLKLQRQFVADAAHQLKTPLAGLRMQAELAQRAFLSGQIDATGLQASLSQVAFSSAQAAHMVNQLLALASADAQALPTSTLNLASTAREAVRDFVPRALAKGIDFGYEGPEDGDTSTALRGHPVLVREALRNLIDNALLYTTPSGGVVTVRVRPAEGAHGPVAEVEDNGPGIAPAERERIFQPFYRSLGTGVDGSGLGLAIVDEAMRRHGGSVALHDAAPGSRFVLRFANERRANPRE